MMQISLENVGKRFNREWIFRHFNYTFLAGKKYAVTGANGSGKSTLLQVISGSLTYNEGTIAAKNDEQTIPAEQFYKNVSIAAPYLELIEEMTAKEILAFHAQFKTLSLSTPEILKIVGLATAIDKQLRYYSSGMKQRLKLAQAFFTTSPIILLDEPTTNLDEDGIALYHQLVCDYTKEKLLIVSSNDKQEYSFCDQVITLSNYK